MLTHRGYVMHIWCINSVFQIQFDFFFFFTYLYTVVLWEKIQYFARKQCQLCIPFWFITSEAFSLCSASDYWIKLKLWIMIQFKSFCREITWKLFKVLSLPIKKAFMSLQPLYGFRKSISWDGGFSKLLSVVSPHAQPVLCGGHYLPKSYTSNLQPLSTRSLTRYEHGAYYTKNVLQFFFCNPFPCYFKSTTNLNL